MNDSLINLRNEIIECFTCDEELMFDESALDNRIDETLQSYHASFIQTNTLNSIDNINKPDDLYLVVIKIKGRDDIAEKCRTILVDGIFNNTYSGNDDIYIPALFVPDELQSLLLKMGFDGTKYLHKDNVMYVQSSWILNEYRSNAVFLDIFSRVLQHVKFQIASIK